MNKKTRKEIFKYYQELDSLLNRISEIGDNLSSIASDERDKYDSAPENLQCTSNYMDMETAADELEELEEQFSEIDEAISNIACTLENYCSEFLPNIKDAAELEMEEYNSLQISKEELSLLINRYCEEMVAFGEKFKKIIEASSEPDTFKEIDIFSIDDIISKFRAQANDNKTFYEVKLLCDKATTELNDLYHSYGGDWNEDLHIVYLEQEK